MTTLYTATGVLCALAALLAAFAAVEPGVALIMVNGERLTLLFKKV